MSNNTTYYAQESGGPTVSGGPIDNSIGGGSFYNNDRHIFIDCYKQSKLISADVFAGTSHNVTFELRDNNSQVIEDKTIFLQTGLNTLQLDFEMPIMNDLELGVSGTGSDLFRNNSGAYYPYPIGNLATITGHNSPYPGDTNYHYFFYNLKVQESCLSNFSAAEAIFMSPSEVKDNKNSDVTIYPNPAKDNFYVISPRQLNSIEVFDISGKRCFIKTKNLIQDGAIGKLTAIQGLFNYYNVDPQNIRNDASIGGGGLLDIGVYPIITSRFVTDLEPKKVVSLIEYDADFKTDILASAILDFGKVQMSFTYSTQSHLMQHMRFVGTQGRLEVPVPFNPMADQKSKIYLWNDVKHPSQEPSVIEIEEADQYQKQIETMNNCILYQKPFPFDLEDSYRNMIIIDSIFKSSQTGYWVSI